ncbi:MAG: hypothetical protein HDT14_07030 [Oscillibacter sp.]|nr:hypothetical protein [Oscillibacter sp.]
MRKKILTLLLAFSLLLSMCPAALAAEEAGVRGTSFFSGREHAGMDYADMAYEHIEVEPLLEEMTAIQALAADAANAAEAEERCSAVIDRLMEMATMYTLISIRQSANVMDEEAAAEKAYLTGAYDVAIDAYSLMMRALLESPCGAFLRELLTEENAAYYLGYEARSEEELALSARETELETEYYQTSAGITVAYNGGEWTDNDAYYAYYFGEISYEDYSAISTACARKQNEILGELYLRMVDLRKEIAASNGYGSYVDYAYEAVYGRDYTQEDIRAFHQAVKDGGFYELYSDLYDLYYAGVDMEVYYGGYTGRDTLELVEFYIDQMSSEMGEAFAYMLRHGLYDIEEDDRKDGSGFTTILHSMNAPFFFNTPYGNIYDFATMVHEFGHYNHYFWADNSWYAPVSSYDAAEVHSQGLELLFSHWYDDIFGESGQFVLDYQLCNLVSVIVQGAIHDELQQFVYAEEDLTLQKINRKYRQLAAEYGLVPADDPRDEMVGWCGISHTFTSPCYYISYATSAAGAFNFWLETRSRDYFDVVDEYLQFVALPGDVGFQESFTRLGMANPISPEYISELAQTLREAMNVDDRLAQLPPEDLTGYEWFAEEVYALYAGGLIEKDEDNCIRPCSPAVWNDAADMLERLMDQRPETGNGGEPITRAAFARLLVDILELEDSSDAPFSDTDDGAVAALAATGAVNGYADGTFRPDQPISRAEMWVIVYRVLMSMVAELMGIAA